MSKPTAKEVVENVTDYLNTFSNVEQEFILEMNREHRTLQQSFTKLCLAWIENCATQDYRFDGRNEASHTISKDIVENFKINKDGFKPSDYLCSI
jgi:hypothetical protein